MNPARNGEPPGYRLDHQEGHGRDAQATRLREAKAVSALRSATAVQRGYGVRRHGSPKDDHDAALATPDLESADALRTPKRLTAHGGGTARWAPPSKIRQIEPNAH
jgi:hypothetical protein